jgi:KDO2-lipid IV(A) lauroyltransferase
MGRFMGRILYALPGRYRSRLRENATQAGYTDAAFARRAAAEVGAMILEMPKVWFREDECIGRVRCDDGQVIKDLAQTGNGILFLIPHHGGFEIAVRYLSKLVPMTIMFRRPRLNALAPVIEYLREATTVASVPAGRSGVRGFVSALRRGEAVGMLPDQVPSQGNGVWASFFGKDAYTVILPGRLAEQTGSTVVMVCCERLARGSGWHLRLTPVAHPLPEGTAAQACAMNAAMEAIIRTAPEQYLWGYHRYKSPKPAPSLNPA